MLDASLVARPKTRKPVQPKDGEAALTVQQAAHRDADADWTKARPQLFRLQEPRERGRGARVHSRLRGDASVGARLAAHQRCWTFPPGRRAGRCTATRVSIPPRRRNAVSAMAVDRTHYKAHRKPAADGATGRLEHALRSKVRARVDT